MRFANVSKKSEIKMFFASFLGLFILFFAFMSFSPGREKINFIIPKQFNQIDQLVQIYFNDREYLLDNQINQLILSPLKNDQENFEKERANFEEKYYQGQNDLRQLIKLSKGFVPKNSASCTDIVKCVLNEVFLSTDNQEFKTRYSEFLNKDLNGPILNQNTNLTAFLATPAKQRLIEYKVEKVGFAVWYQKKILLAFFGALSLSLILTVVTTKRPWDV